MKNIKDLMRRHADLEMRRAAIEECLALIGAEFSSRDGIPPNKIVLTEDGKRVPPTIFTEILAEISERVLDPILQELSTLEEKKLK